MYVYILGQTVDEEHVTVSAPDPGHCLPSYFGAGFEQERVRVRVPEVDRVPNGVQEAEQPVQEVQEVHTPSTV